MTDYAYFLTSCRHFPDTDELIGKVYVSTDEGCSRQTYIYDSRRIPESEYQAFLYWASERFSECEQVEVGLPTGNYHNLWAVYPNESGQDWIQRA